MPEMPHRGLTGTVLACRRASDRGAGGAEVGRVNIRVFGDWDEAVCGRDQGPGSGRAAGEEAGRGSGGETGRAKGLGLGGVSRRATGGEFRLASRSLDRGGNRTGGRGMMSFAGRVQ